MRVSMIGAGYVGLVSGACLADFGHHVVCIDKDARAGSQALKRGEIPIFEPGLSDLVAQQYSPGPAGIRSGLGQPVAAAEAVFIAVGTPIASRRRACRSELRL